MTNNEIKINDAMKKINEAISELKAIYNDVDTSLYLMCKISDKAQLLNNTDF